MNIKGLNKYKKTLSLFLGSLSVLALPPYYIFPILFITFSGLTLLLTNTQTKKQAFACGYWFGFGFFALGLSWIGNALLIEAATFGWLYPLTLIASGAFFGLFFGIPTLLTHYFKGTTAKILSLTALIVLFEWLRSFILTGFPWNLLGTTLAFSIELMQAAAVFGTYGLSLAVILTTSLPALFIKEKNKTGLIAPVFILYSLYMFGQFRTEQHQDVTMSGYYASDISIKIVQPAIPQTMKWSKETLENNFQEHIDLSKTGKDANLIIWGETASPFRLDTDEPRRKQIADSLAENSHLITGLVRVEASEQGIYQPLNSSVIINKQGGIVDFYDKSHLVPFGEYIPFRRYLPVGFRPITNTISDFRPGEKHKKIQIPGIPPFGILICYEIIFPGQIVDRNNRPEWLINLTNDGWYGDSSGPRQHLVSTQLRAIEEGMAIVRVANTGISALISKTGRILGKIELNRKGILEINLPKRLNISTLYSRLGNSIPLALIIVIILSALALSRRYKR